MKGLIRALFAFSLLIQAGSVEPGTLDLDAVLDEMIAAYGGEQNLRKLDSMAQEWDFVAMMGNRRGTDIRQVSIPGRLKVELTYPDKSEIRILDGDFANVIFNHRPSQQATSPQRDAMRLQLMRMYSPLVLREKREALALTQEGTLVALSLNENGLRVDYLIDPESWTIQIVVGTLNIHGTEMQFRTEYSDFRFHDGVLVHEKENKFAGGVNTAVLTLRKITLGAELGDNLFEPDHHVRQSL
jgi:hypothetical protein